MTLNGKTTLKWSNLKNNSCLSYLQKKKKVVTVLKLRRCLQGPYRMQVTPLPEQANYILTPLKFWNYIIIIEESSSIG